MPTHTEKEESEDIPEVLRVRRNRYNFFNEVLGDDFPADKIKELVDSSASPHDAKKLLDAGCPPELIPQILV